MTLHKVAVVGIALALGLSSLGAMAHSVMVQRESTAVETALAEMKVIEADGALRILSHALRSASTDGQFRDIQACMKLFPTMGNELSACLVSHPAVK